MTFGVSPVLEAYGRLPCKGVESVIFKGERQMLNFTYDEELCKLLDYIVNHMINQVKDSIPESGSFNKVLMSFSTHFTGEHKGLLYIEPYSADPDQRKVVAGVIKAGTDKLYSNIMTVGTNEELVRYFSDSGTVDDLIDSYKKLFVSADED